MSDVLVIDTSTQSVEIAIGTTNQDCVAKSREQYSAHSENILVCINEALNDRGITIKNIDAIGVGVGPGLFTGLRVGITTAHSIAHALNIPLVYFSSLELSALSSLNDKKVWTTTSSSDTVYIARDARRNELYFAGYELNISAPSEVIIDSTKLSTQLNRIEDEQLISPEEYVKLANETENAIFILDDIDKYEQFNDLLPDVKDAMLTAKIDPSKMINHVIDCVMGSLTHDIYSPDALYIRKSDAELSWGKSSNDG